jgi:multidrug transporter EmrE-like cation transporter
MLNLIPLAFAGLMAFIDTFVLALFKGYSLGQITWNAVIPFGMLLYSLHPFIFLKSLKYESMTVMNLLFDVISDVTITTVGLLFFKESISNMKKVGLILAFMGIVLMSWDSLNSGK